MKTPKKSKISKTTKPVRTRPPFTDKDGEIRPLTKADIMAMRPAAEVLPELVALYKKSRGRPKKDVVAKPISIRLDPDVEHYFRSTGDGWQTRINNVLRDAIGMHKHLSS